MPRWMFFVVGILGLIGAAWTAVDTVSLLNMGIDEGMGIFYFFIVFLLLFGAAFIAIGMKMKK